MGWNGKCVFLSSSHSSFRMCSRVRQPASSRCVSLQVSVYEIQYSPQGVITNVVPRQQLRHQAPALCCDFNSIVSGLFPSPRRRSLRLFFPSPFPPFSGLYLLVYGFGRCAVGLWREAKTGGACIVVDDDAQVALDPHKPHPHPLSHCFCASDGEDGEPTVPFLLVSVHFCRCFLLRPALHLPPPH